MAIGCEWLKFGQYPGGKTEDLMELDSLKPDGIDVVRGISIGASYFFDYKPYHELPVALRELNGHILPFLTPNKWWVVRSSATDEGPCGIYNSHFFIPRADSKINLEELERFEEDIYLSYFSSDSRAYRRQKEIMGMGLLIQPVIGSWFENDFAPVISGVCTYEESLPLIKVVAGLGTKAVRRDAGVFYHGLDYFNPQEVADDLRWHRETDLLSTITAGLRENQPIPDSLREKVLAETPKLFDLYEVWKRYAQAGKPFYWEFAIDSSSKVPIVIQSSLEVAQAGIEPVYAEPKGRVVVEGVDLVNMGIKEGNEVFYLESEYGLNSLAEWNKTHKGYALVLHDLILSSGLGVLSFRHFSNSSVVIELQDSGIHKIGRTGGCHFAELCKRRDILFLGVYFADWDQTPLSDLLGKEKAAGDEDFSTWDIGFRVTNTRKKGRLEVFDN